MKILSPRGVLKVFYECIILSLLKINNQVGVIWLYFYMILVVDSGVFYWEMLFFFHPLVWLGSFSIIGRISSSLSSFWWMFKSCLKSLAGGESTIYKLGLALKKVAQTLGGKKHMILTLTYISSLWRRKCSSFQGSFYS